MVSMLMEGKISIDLNRRNVSLTRLAWNKATPTRWAKTVSGEISAMASKGPVVLTVNQDQLIAKIGEREIPVFRSHAYAASLFRAGVTEIDVGWCPSPEQVKNTLDVLSDKGIVSLTKGDLITNNIYRLDAIDVKGKPIVSLGELYRETVLLNIKGLSLTSELEFNDCEKFLRENIVIFGPLSIGLFSSLGFGVGLIISAVTGNNLECGVNMCPYGKNFTQTGSTIMGTSVLVGAGIGITLPIILSTINLFGAATVSTVQYAYRIARLPRIYQMARSYAKDNSPEKASELKQVLSKTPMSDWLQNQIIEGKTKVGC